MLTVTATAPTGSLLSIANRGLRSVDLAAPGGQILSTAMGSGTSCARAPRWPLPSSPARSRCWPPPAPTSRSRSLRGALVQSAPRPKLLAGLLVSGALNVARSAMHTVLPGDMWRARRPAADAAAADAEAIALEVTATRRLRAGRSATVSWTATGADRVCLSWRVLLDGKRIKTLPGAKSQLRKKVNRPGTHRCKVVGLDAEGTKVVSAARRFKVLRSR